jgi:ABC-type multidrug transport system fused ATPase/permease subunit
MTGPTGTTELPLAGDNARPDAGNGWLPIVHLSRLSWKVRTPLVLLIVLTMAQASATGAVLVFLQRGIGEIVRASTGSFPAAFLFDVGLALTLQIVGAVCGFLADIARRRYLERIEGAIFRWSLEQMFLLPADAFHAQTVVTLAIHLEKIQNLGSVYLTTGTTLITRGAVGVGILIGVITQVPWYAASGLTVLAILGLMLHRRSLRMRELIREEMAGDARLADQTHVTFANLREMHALGLMDQAAQQFESACQGVFRRRSRIARMEGQVVLVMSGLGIVMLAILLAFGWLFRVGIGEVLTSFVGMAMLLDPLGDMLRSWTVCQTRASRLGDMFAFFERMTGSAAHRGETLLSGPVETLEFADVSFQPKLMQFPLGRAGRPRDLSQPRTAPILEGVRFSVRKGEILGIVGRSGAGKTTLARLALGMIQPTQGTVRINGCDLGAIQLSSYWRQASTIVQVPYLVEGTLTEEVALAYLPAAAEQLAKAMDAAGIEPELREHVLTMDDPEDDGRHSTWFTRSLHQRVEWARLWLRPASLVVLDEPTSLADSPGEQLFLRELLRRRHQQITLVISHRPATLSICDRLLVLEGGRVVGDGPPEVVLPRWLPQLGDLQREAA